MSEEIEKQVHNFHMKNPELKNMAGLAHEGREKRKWQNY